MLEAVEGFVKQIDPVATIANLEVQRLLDVDFVVDCRIEKCCFEIELKDKKLKHVCDGEESTYGRGFDDRCESVGVIETRDL